jgi:hypothetical protein
MTTDAPVIKEVFIPDEVPKPADIPVTKPAREPVKQGA